MDNQDLTNFQMIIVVAVGLNWIKKVLKWGKRLRWEEYPIITYIKIIIEETIPVC